MGRIIKGLKRGGEDSLTREREKKNLERKRVRGDEKQFSHKLEFS